MRILAFETSCDDTAVGIVENGVRVLSNVRHTQKDHDAYGGVVPEIAARRHNEVWRQVLEDALQQAKCTWDDIDTIAVTQGPGLQSSLLTGTSVASMLSLLYNKPLIPVHHILGHVTSCALDRGISLERVQLPALVLTVSGGHTSMYLWKSAHDVQEIGKTLDDAAGEAFDKVSRMLGLGYPGGPIVSRYAEKGDRRSFELPYIYLEKESLDFSFSGLKAAVKRIVERNHPELLKEGAKDLPETPDIQTFRANICASFEYVIGKIMIKKVGRALECYPEIQQIHFVGGVSANTYLREQLGMYAKRSRRAFSTPIDFGYCTDNGAMIAGAAYWLWKEDSSIAKIQYVEADTKRSI